MHSEHDNEQESDRTVDDEMDAGGETSSQQQEQELRPRRVRGRRRAGRGVRGVVWEFFHPPAAAWSAPGEGRVRSVASRLAGRMERSRGLSAAVAVGAVALVAVLFVAGWAVSRPSGEAPSPPTSSSSSTVEETAGPGELPGRSGAAGEGAGGEAASDDEAALSGQEADEATLDRINAGDGLISARAGDADDPLVTSARFLRSLRSTDTTSDSVEDWYAARDSFLAEPQAGRQTDWGEAGQKEAVSSAEISWAEMDAAISQGRGIAPEFAFGPEVAPGTHLVQVGMRLDQSRTAGDETVEVPSGALMEAVVVCPPAEGVDRCVVTRWSEEPAGFTASMDEAWEVSS